MQYFESAFAYRYGCLRRVDEIRLCYKASSDKEAMNKFPGSLSQKYIILCNTSALFWVVCFVALRAFCAYAEAFEGKPIMLESFKIAFW